jgi:GNAT superfamily N-acetyltransferase
VEIIDLMPGHAEQALVIVRRNYDEARLAVPALPPIAALPDISGLAENGLGVVAIEEGRMIGFLCALGPFPGAFGSTDAVGVFSPLHGNGAIGGNRARVYARMYQAAGAKWARVGAASHAICLYAHDREVQEQFYRYGFGLRCIDAIRAMEEPAALPYPGLACHELFGDDRLRVYPLDLLLGEHMAASPTFMRREIPGRDEFARRLRDTRARYFVACDGGEVTAFLKVEEGAGETFVAEAPGYQHVNGAFCLPRYRGQGVYLNLLAHVIRVLKGEGWPLLGVDFESINPAANGFWLKYFAAYTHSVVRRVDEHSIDGSL